MDTDSENPAQLLDHCKI